MWALGWDLAACLHQTMANIHVVVMLELFLPHPGKDPYTHRYSSSWLTVQLSHILETRHHLKSEPWALTTLYINQENLLRTLDTLLIEILVSKLFKLIWARWKCLVWSPGEVIFKNLFLLPSMHIHTEKHSQIFRL